MRLGSLLLFVGIAASGVAQPTITAVTNAATFTGALAPGSLAAIFGSGLATGTAQYSSFPLPITLGGALVSINSVPCPLLYASSGFIDFQVPYNVAPGNATLVVTAGSTPSSAITLTIIPAAPAIFPEPAGQAAARNQDSTVNTTTNPAVAGSAIAVYFTGIGATSPIGLTGGVNPGALDPSTLSYSATIGGVNAPVSYFGLTPTATSGLAQANLTVPQLPSGNYPVVLTVNGTSSLSGIVSVSGSGTGEPTVLTLAGSANVVPNAAQTFLSGGTGVAVSGNTAYVCDPDKITVIDVTNPASPQVGSAFGQSDLNGGGGRCSIEQGDLVALVNGNALVVYSLSNPAQPQRVGSVSLTDGDVCGNGAFFGSNELLVTCHLSYSLGSGEITEEDGEAEMYSLSNPASPALASTLAPNTTFPGNDNNSPRFAVGAVDSQTAAILGTTSTGSNTDGGTAQFSIVNVSNPAAMNVVAQVMVPQATILDGIGVQNGTGLIVGNTKSWENPVGTDPVTGGLAIPLTGFVTLTTVNFSTSTSPVVLATTVTNFQSWGTPAVAPLGSGFFAVLLTPPPSDLHGPSMLAVVDARNPQNPVFTPFAWVAGQQNGITVSGSNLYVGTSLGINIYSIGAP